MSGALDPKEAYTPPTLWSTSRILPEGFLPMLATSTAASLESLEYAYEPRWEGLRMLVGLEGHQVFVRTGAGQDALFWFPELAESRTAAKPAWVLLDAEMVVLDEGRPSQIQLQQRLRASDQETVERLAEERPATLMVFDILRIGDSWLLDVTWEDRREILLRAVHANERVKISPVSREGRDALDGARDLGLDSVVAKRLRGRYFPGDRTRDWLNIKPLEVIDAVICGWTEGRGARAGTVGSLLLGSYRNGKLVYIGHTGTGLGPQTLPVIHQELAHRAQKRCPFADEPALNSEPHWVRPELGCRIRYQGWTDTGHMRSPTFLELAAAVVSR